MHLMHKHTVFDTMWVGDSGYDSINTLEECTRKYMMRDRQKAMPVYTTGAAGHQSRGLLVAEAERPQLVYRSRWPCHLGERRCPSLEGQSLAGPRGCWGVLGTWDESEWGC